MAISTAATAALELVRNNPTLLTAVSLFTVFVWFIYSFFYGGQKGKNPLQNDSRRPPEPVVHDTKVRDAVLKERFRSTKVPDNLDIIIIGSGAGGLSAGVLIAKAGKKVLILEQHDQAGGCCHTFVEKGFEFDTGIHYIGDLGEKSYIRTLLDQLTNGQLRWTKLDDTFDTVAVGKPATAKLYPMKTGENEYYQNLIDFFPQEKAAILAFKDLIKDASRSFSGIIVMKFLPRWLVSVLVATGLHRLLIKLYRKGYATKSLQEVLDELTDNKELKLVLSYIAGDYGVLPKDAPFVLHAGLIDHYKNGAYYPVNGSSEIVFQMIKIIQNGGGKVLVQAPVTKILCDQIGRAVGVRVGTNQMDIHAKYIISDAGVVNTFKTLLPENIAKTSSIYPLIGKVGPSYSFLSAFIGFEGSQSELKLPAGNIWTYNTSDINKTVGEYIHLNADEVETADIPFGFISFPSAKDSEWEKKFPGKSTALVITYSKWEWFEEWKDEKVRHRGNRYESIKDVLGRKMLQQCIDLFPQLDGKKVYMEVGTPVTNQYYLAAPQGEMYGLDHKLSRFEPDVVSKLRTDTDIKGLYLTGQDVMTCGFTPAILTGLFCASKILNRNLFHDLLKLKKDIGKAGSVSNGLNLKKKE